MSAPRVFSTAELGTLHDLQCWIDLPHATSSSRSDPEWDTNAEANEVDSRDGSDEGRTGYNGVVVREAYHVLEGETGPRASGSDGLHVAGTERSEDGQTDQQAKNMERILHEEGWTRRRHSDGALLAWLRSIELRLTDKCAELCDVAWFELGETITFRGRPVVLDIPPEAMNEAMQRRVERDRMND